MNINSYRKFAIIILCCLICTGCIPSRHAYPKRKEYALNIHYPLRKSNIVSSDILKIIRYDLY